MHRDPVIDEVSKAAAVQMTEGGATVTQPKVWHDETQQWIEPPPSPAAAAAGSCAVAEKTTVALSADDTNGGEVAAAAAAIDDVTIAARWYSTVLPVVPSLLPPLSLSSRN
jgi:hypothetical protein